MSCPNANPGLVWKRESGSVLLILIRARPPLPLTTAGRGRPTLAGQCPPPGPVVDPQSIGAGPPALEMLLSELEAQLVADLSDLAPKAGRATTEHMNGVGRR